MCVQTGAMVFGVLYMIATLLGLLNLAGHMLQLNDRVIGSAGLPIGIMVSCLSEMCAGISGKKIFFLLSLLQSLFFSFVLASLSSFSF